MTLPQLCQLLWMMVGVAEKQPLLVDHLTQHFEVKIVQKLFELALGPSALVGLGQEIRRASGYGAQQFRVLSCQRR